MRVNTDLDKSMLGRRTELDWLRIGAFGLLILFHVGMFYVPWQWEVKSPRVLPWLQVPLDWSTPWRLLLLFVVSGAATRFMSLRLSPRDLFIKRSLYLLPPLVFALAVVTPPQMYVRAIEQFDYTGSFSAFLRRYFSFDHSFCRPDDCLVMPNWNHLWFVAYLWVYTVLLLVALALVPNLFAGIQARGEALLRGSRLLVLPALTLGLAHIALAHFFPETHDITNDWYLHTIYLATFLFGFLFVFSKPLWSDLVKRRWLALVIGIACYATHTAYELHFHGHAIPMAVKLPMSLVFGFEQWSWVVAMMGFARLYLAGRDGSVRRYLTEAIFPYYIVHQFTIVLVGHALARLGLPLPIEAALLLTATVASCALAYEVARRLPLLRPWFGLKRMPTQNALPAPLVRAG